MPSAIRIKEAINMNHLEQTFELGHEDKTIYMCKWSCFQYIIFK